MSSSRAVKKNRAWSQQSTLLPPNPTPDALTDREEWISNAYNGFISPSAANKEIYRVILETLWPSGHGIPGPVIDRDAIRSAIDVAKGRPYHDPFRRLRELQGEEGFLGIIKQGTQYQLTSLNIYPKKQPRTHLPDDKWAIVLDHYQNLCAACGNPPDEAGFQQDHKVPRLRGGTDILSNWQPLCDSCNNQKSVACRGCTQDCTTCGWAYPEHYKPLKIPGAVLRSLHQFANEHHLDADILASQWISDKLKENSK